MGSADEQAVESASDEIPLTDEATITGQDLALAVRRAGAGRPFGGEPQDFLVTQGRLADAAWLQWPPPAPLPDPVDDGAAAADAP